MTGASSIVDSFGCALFRESRGSIVLRWATEYNRHRRWENASRDWTVRKRKRVRAIEQARLDAISDSLHDAEVVIENTSAQIPGPGGVDGVLYLTQVRLLFHGPYGSPQGRVLDDLTLTGIVRAGYEDRMLVLEFDTPKLVEAARAQGRGTPMSVYQLYPGLISDVLVGILFNGVEMARSDNGLPPLVRIVEEYPSRRP
jgi:hypothetical protein